MKPIVVRNVKIGEGRPKICVPIVGNTSEDIISEAKTFSSLPVDIAEWRADWYDDIFQPGKALGTAEKLRNALGDIPLLFTFRTSREGGQKDISASEYTSLNIEIAKNGLADLIDIELFMGAGLVRHIIEEAHTFSVKTVVSNHDFLKTPEQKEIVKRLEQMLELGADIPKIAVMPKNRKDVLTLLLSTLEISETHQDSPIATMSMSGTGVISRLAGESFGSAITFGAASKASAPGQIDVKDLRLILDIIHKSL